MTTETIIIDGQPIEIWYETPEYRQAALDEATLLVSASSEPSASSTMPLTEIVSMNGQEVHIWYDSPEYREAALYEANGLLSLATYPVEQAVNISTTPNEETSINTNTDTDTDTNTVSSIPSTEIVSINGQEIQIWYDSPEYREAALYEANSLMASLAPTCTATSKTVGQVINLSTTPTLGTSPYTFSFWKMLPGTTTKVAITGTPNATNTSATASYTTTITDIGTLTVGVDITDSCGAAGGGPKSASEQCVVNVSAACATPVPGLVVT